MTDNDNNKIEIGVGITTTIGTHPGTGLHFKVKANNLEANELIKIRIV